MIELTKEQFAMAIMDLMTCTSKIPVSSTTHNIIAFLFECYKDNKHIITIGVK